MLNFSLLLICEGISWKWQFTPDNVNVNIKIPKNDRDFSPLNDETLTAVTTKVNTNISGSIKRYYGAKDSSRQRIASANSSHELSEASYLCANGSGIESRYDSSILSVSFSRPIIMATVLRRSGLDDIASSVNLPGWRPVIHFRITDVMLTPFDMHLALNIETTSEFIVNLICVIPSFMARRPVPFPY